MWEDCKEMKNPKKQLSKGDQLAKEYHEKNVNSLSFADAIKRATESMKKFSNAIKGLPG